jgi:hypothetical protein
MLSRGTKVNWVVEFSSFSANPHLVDLKELVVEPATLPGLGYFTLTSPYHC